MIEHIISTGDTGSLKIQDNTDNPSLMTVELWVKSSSPVNIPNLPWTYSVNGSQNSWKSFNFTNTTLWQYLGGVYVGTLRTAALILGATNTSQLAGPTTHEIELAGYVEPINPTPPSGEGSNGEVRVLVDGVYRRATPYVNVNDVWTVATPYVRSERGWVRLG